MQLPARIGKYELIEFLGGGMSEVYRAQDTVIGRTVVVKILTPEGCADAQAKARFLQEVRLAGNLQHENIVAVHDYGEEQGRPYIVMEFLRGEDLRNAIRSGHAGSLLDRLKLAVQISRALGHIHTFGIIHRDIKPENIHIDPSGKVKLMDFGIAKTRDLSLTQAGTTVGTPYYMAPEQVAGKELTPAADIYSFGIVLYEMLSGQRAIQGNTIEQLFYQILREPIAVEPLERAGVPPQLCDVVMRAVAKRPEDRYPSFEAVTAALEQIIQAAETSRTPTQPMPAPEEPVRKNRWLAPALGAVILVSVAVAAWFLFVHRPAGLPKTIDTKSGVMVVVDAGSFLSGRDKKPVTLPTFYIDQTEVSNREYAEFCRATGRQAPAAEADLPVVNITMDDARAFAKWAGQRLPTALEWEKAARGTKGWTYPWGDDANPSYANVRDNPRLSKRALMPVGSSFPNSISPYNAYNMVGNAAELVEGAITPSAPAVEMFRTLLNPPPTASEPWYEIRGGSFNVPLVSAVTYEWIAVPGRFASADIGFRCAKNP